MKYTKKNLVKVLNKLSFWVDKNFSEVQAKSLLVILASELIYLETVDSSIFGEGVDKTILS